MSLERAWIGPNLELIPKPVVILSGAKNLASIIEILRFAQDDENGYLDRLLM